MNRCVAILLGSVLGAGCNGQVDDGVGIGGETHFLVTCGEDCGPGLACIEGVCTRRCEPGYSSCSELASDAGCVSAPEIGGSASAGICDVLCSSDAECAPLGVGYLCQAGACRAAPEARPLGSLRSKGLALVNSVDVDTCLSGLRWTGGDHGSAEMHPGSDCVGCHRDTGARSLMIGGTVYGHANPYTGPDPLEGCFGLEGVEVVVKVGDNGLGVYSREYSTVTNRAGNFYIEGPTEFDGPYVAEIRWSSLEPAGDPHITPMFTSPIYGGCARCHSATAKLTDLSNYDLDYDPSLDPNFVTPARSVIFPPGLYPRLDR